VTHEIAALIEADKAAEVNQREEDAIRQRWGGGSRGLGEEKKEDIEEREGEEDDDETGWFLSDGEDEEDDAALGSPQLWVDKGSDASHSAAQTFTLTMQGRSVDVTLQIFTKYAMEEEGEIHERTPRASARMGLREEELQHTVTHCNTLEYTETRHASARMGLKEMLSMLTALGICPAPFSKSAVVSAVRCVTATRRTRTHTHLDATPRMSFADCLGVLDVLYQDDLAGKNIDPQLAHAATIIQRRVRGAAVRSRKALQQSHVSMLYARWYMYVRTYYLYITIYAYIYT